MKNWRDKLAELADAIRVESNIKLRRIAVLEAELLSLKLEIATEENEFVAIRKALDA